MRKILSFAIVAAVVAYFAACSVEMDYNPNHEKPILKNPYVVSIPQAIDRLNAMFPNSVTATRARVSEVTTLSRKDFGLITRANTTEDAPLIYIIPTDNEGCAIMGADSRMTPLYAVLESTTLTAEDFLSMNTRTDSGDSQEEDSEIREFVAGMLNDAITNDARLVVPGIGSNPIATIDADTVVDQGGVKPLLRTKWNQELPFNSKYPDSLKKAGCGPIAAAQIIYFHRQPDRISPSDSLFIWDYMERFEYNKPTLAQLEYARNEIGRFIWAIGKAMGAHRSPTNPEKTATRPSAFVPLTELIPNYKRGELISFEETKVLDMLDSNMPIYTVGSKISGGGHAWVLDGYELKAFYKYDESMNEYIPKGAFIYLHCNFGWGGRCDGYYRDGIFDLRAPGDGFNLSDDTDESIGDIYVPTNRIYTNIRIVYNNKN